MSTAASAEPTAPSAEPTAASAEPPARRASHRRRRAARAWAAALAAPLALAVVVLAAAPAYALPQLQSQGSSFAGVAIEQWVGQSQAAFGLNVNFQITSSVLGLNAFAANQVDFAASDIPYSSGQADANPTQPFQYMPDVAGALAFMYNLNGLNGQQITGLVLNAATVGEIFSGKITYWNDPAITSINPLSVAENLPHTKIIPVYREDASGESYLLSDYLLHQDQGPFEAYQAAVGSAVGDPSAAWPVPQAGQPLPSGYPNVTSLTAANGSDGVANFVSALSSQGSIGYLETAYALEHNFPVASLVNASGHAVQPTSDNDATALEKAILYADLTQNLVNVYANPLPNAYPISAYSYLVAPCTPALAAPQHFSCAGPQTASPFNAAKGAELGQFVSFLACAGQQKMKLLGYSPLPPNLVEEDFQAVGRMNGGKEPPPPTAQNCHNPYVDGQDQLPGAPVVSATGPPPPGSQNVGNVLGTTTTTTTTVAGSPGTGTTVPGPGGAGHGGAGPGGSGNNAPGSHGSGPGSGPQTPGARSGVGGSNSLAVDPIQRLTALRNSAVGLAGPPVGAMVALWCGVLVAALVLPPLLVAWWRRRHPATPDGAGPGGAP